MNLHRIVAAAAVTCALSGVASAQSGDRPPEERSRPRLSFTPPLDGERGSADAMLARPAPRDTGPRRVEDDRYSGPTGPAYSDRRPPADARQPYAANPRGEEFRGPDRPDREPLADRRNDGASLDRPRDKDLLGKGLQVVAAVKSFADAVSDRPAPRPYADDRRGEGRPYGDGHPTGGYDRPAPEDRRFSEPARPGSDGYGLRRDDGPGRAYAGGGSCRPAFHYSMGQGRCVPNCSPAFHYSDSADRCVPTY